MAKDLEYYLAQARRIAEHREANAEKEIRKIYKTMLKDLQGFMSETYVQLAEDDKLTYSMLQKAGYDARFLQEIEQRINKSTPAAAKKVQELVEQTYTAAYEGMVTGVEKAAQGSMTLDEAFENSVAITPEQIKAAVQNPVDGLTLADKLEKNRKEIIYSIKRAVGVGLMNGDRYTTMAKMIAEQVDNDYTKAIRIARTETHRVREAGNVDAALSVDEEMKNGTSGMRMVKTWRTMKDERVRPQVRRKGKKGWKTTMRGSANHMKMEDVTVLADEPFDLGGGVKAMAPGNSGDASNDINCRCYVSYEMMTDEQFFKKTGKHFTGGNSFKALTEKEHKALAKSMKVTQEQHDAIYDERFGYVGTSAYDRINKVFRGEYDAAVLKAKHLDTIEALDEVIDKNKLSHSVRVNRWVDNDFLQKQFGISRSMTTDAIVKALENQAFTEKGFLSTSSSSKHMFSSSNRVQMLIDAKEGTHAYVTEDFDEMEILFGRGAKLKFDSVTAKEDNIIIVAELVGYDTDEKRKGTKKIQAIRKKQTAN